MNELFAIAGSTWRNVLRLKVVYFLVFCVWVLVACALNYDVLSLGLEKELLIDASLMLNTVTAVLIVLGWAGGKWLTPWMSVFSLLAYIPLIWSIVRRYYGRGVEPDDLYQLGCLGFIKAIKGFDFAFGTQFSTYAVPKIAGEIRRFLRDDGAIKVSRSMREQAATIFAAREKLKNTLGREPALSELSEETGFNAEEIAQCELAVAAPDSLQRETGDGLTLEGMLGGESPEDGLIERIALREAIDELPEREKMTILLRFFKGLTQEQAARLLGVSQVQVSRLERRALEKLRASLSDGL